MPTIHLSDPTFEALQKLAIPFEDREPEDVIRRLINGFPTSSDPASSTSPPNSGRDLVNHAGRIPNGSELRANYKGRMYEAKVSDGAVLWNGQAFTSLSNAAVAVIQSTGSTRSTENGWRFWDVKVPDSEEWLPGYSFQNSKT